MRRLVSWNVALCGDLNTCEYEHGLRERGLSDHAALIADLVVPGS
jgi:hypothetical protein